ncbi:MAG: FtsQ-type POTRA domain-containing protein [Desertifilum sp. SIO1I2]|nr:FtsQ-type POTRA domain-containing protein [Desertifilum sp. SIO1I2]
MITSVTQADLATRRQHLRKSRRIKIVQTIWRSAVVSGIAGGVVWVTTLPGWVIRQSEQVAIAGNQFLSTQAIRSLLPIDYPQSLFRLEPYNIANTLEAKGPIAAARVNRQLFPPRLTVQVTERHPVAVAIAPTGHQPSQNASVGLLDEQGVWMPQESYTALNQSFPLPTLKIVGKPDTYRLHWREVYPIVHRSPIGISTIDWQDPNNLKLDTELGVVHLGPYSPKFEQQIKTLDQMRQLSERVNPAQIAYIDLKNPAAPMLQLR